MSSGVNAGALRANLVRVRRRGLCTRPRRIRLDDLNVIDPNRVRIQIGEPPASAFSPAEHALRLLTDLHARVSHARPAFAPAGPQTDGRKEIPRLIILTPEEGTTVRRHKRNGPQCDRVSTSALKPCPLLFYNGKM